MKNIFSADWIHRWIIPFLHATLWAAGLLCTLKADAIFSYVSGSNIEIIKFLAIFVVLFLEVMIVLLDIYVDKKAHYLAPRFILFVILLFGVLILTSISAGLAFSCEQNKILPLGVVLMASSALKFIENLLMNNTHWYIINNPSIFNASGIYINREIKLI